ncbi:MAG: hypothetical protein Q9170_002358 [Blastenia crenularia]
MRLLLTSALFSLPIATFAALEAGAPGAEPTTTLSSTSTLTLTKTLASNVVTATSTLASGESAPPPLETSSATPSSSSAEAVSSSAVPVATSPVTSSPAPATTTSAPAPYMTPVPSFNTSATIAPYPIPGSSGGIAPSGFGTAAPTGTGVPVPPVTPFQAAGTRVGGQGVLVALGAVVVGLFTLL